MYRVASIGVPATSSWSLVLPLYFYQLSAKVEVVSIWGFSRGFVVPHLMGFPRTASLGSSVPACGLSPSRSPVYRGWAMPYRGAGRSTGVISGGVV